MPGQELGYESRAALFADAGPQRIHNLRAAAGEETSLELSCFDTCSVNAFFTIITYNIFFDLIVFFVTTVFH